LRLAVNEAGSDAASMRQIRSLQPEVIKLGRGLIAEVETVSSCQYLVADLVEFGRQTGAVYPLQESKPQPNWPCLAGSASPPAKAT
jgi:EAL domain-containing protein (putative c-di-GMP-specific phosphodiesterase class I)